MENTPRVKAVYIIEKMEPETESVDWSGDVPPIMLAYLRERRRALITELRRIEELLQLQSTLPQRTRPH